MNAHEPSRTSDQDDRRADPSTPERRPTARLATTVEHDPASLSGLRRTIKSWLSATDIGEATADDIVLAVSEAVSNAIDHSRVDSHVAHHSPGAEGPACPPKVSDSPTGDHQIEVDLSCDAWTVTVTVVDHGKWRTVDRSERSTTRGRGMRIIRAVMDSYEVRPGESGTIVTMTKRLTQPDHRSAVD